MPSVFVWTSGDVIGLGLLALFLIVLVLLWLAALAQTIARRVRNTFRNLWSRFNG